MIIRANSNKCSFDRFRRWKTRNNTSDFSDALKNNNLAHSCKNIWFGKTIKQVRKQGFGKECRFRTKLKTHLFTNRSVYVNKHIMIQDCMDVCGRIEVYVGLVYVGLVFERIVNTYIGWFPQCTIKMHFASLYDTLTLLREHNTSFWEGTAHFITRCIYGMNILRVLYGECCRRLHTPYICRMLSAYKRHTHVP